MLRIVHSKEDRSGVTVYTRTSRALSPDASVRPSGANARALMAPLWGAEAPLSARARSSPTEKKWILLSAPPTATRVPSSEALRHVGSQSALASPFIASPSYTRTNPAVATTVTSAFAQSAIPRGRCPTAMVDLNTPLTESPTLITLSGPPDATTPSRAAMAETAPAWRSSPPSAAERRRCSNSALPALSSAAVTAEPSFHPVTRRLAAVSHAMQVMPCCPPVTVAGSAVMSPPAKMFRSPRSARETMPLSRHTTATCWSFTSAPIGRVAAAVLASTSQHFSALSPPADTNREPSGEKAMPNTEPSCLSATFILPIFSPDAPS
mmetsp:Transcript_28165/g.66597  ORF Transcript_28165/g.66597 Transcript_28165/m.66597 type:complete len:323 (-) Transcript_28165:707-1675(-)